VRRFVRRPELVPLPFSRKALDAYLPLDLLSHHRSDLLKDEIFEEERTALHGGKLGDIIYALPTCRALGVNHLVLSTFLSTEDRLRSFPYSAAQQIVPLLLAQPYLREVSIVKSPFPLEKAGPSFPGIYYNLDTFRLMPRHRIGDAIYQVPRFCHFDDEDAPSHLGEHFAAAVGIQVDLSEPWLFVEPSPKTLGALVVSLTHNWRSYSDQYWRTLLKGIPNLVFVGTEVEFHRADLPHARFIPTKDHFELASLIAGARGFLGTVSFPYSLAEGLKVPRLVEVCHHNLNAFPVGNAAEVLPPDLSSARGLVDRLLTKSEAEIYQVNSPRRWSPRFWFSNQTRRIRFRFTKANISFVTRLRGFLISLLRPIRRIFH
jgi:hypothetical protein